MMTEIDYLIEISEKLDIIIIIGIFALAIHFAERWLKLWITIIKERK